jgi:hypothetical protein
MQIKKILLLSLNRNGDIEKEQLQMVILLLF